MFNALRRKADLYRFLYLHRRKAALIEKWQGEQLRILMAHAMYNVPLYKELYLAARVHFSDLQTLSDIRKLPLTHKDLFLGRPAEEITRGDRRIPRKWKKSSGSTGKPRAALMSSAFESNFYANFACFRFLLGTVITPRAFRDIRIAHINLQSAPRKGHLFTTITEFLADPDGVLQKITAHRPQVIASFPSVLLEVAKRLGENPNLLPEKPRYASSFGEMLTPSTRHEIEEKLGCEVFDRYGATEIGAAASECRQHNGMHIHSESAIVEILNEKNETVPSGVRGKVVVTDLLNYNMPFIRYEIGDYGRLSYERCPCGQETPRLWLEGRFTANLVFGEKVINHIEFEGVFDDLVNAVLQYRVIKVADDELHAELIPGPAYRSIVEQKIIRRVQKLIGPNVRIRVAVVHALPRTLRGKSQIINDHSLAV